MMTNTLAAVDQMSDAAVVTESAPNDTATVTEAAPSSIATVTKVASNDTATIAAPQPNSTITATEVAPNDVVTASPNALEVHSLTKRYKKSDFRLDNVSFTLPSGAIMGLVGENGSGKTTTIGCILNTLIKDSGTVRVFGEEMDDASTTMRDDIGIVFDSPNFSDDLTASKVSSVLRRIYSKWDDNLYSEYLQKFSLPPKQKIKTFSRGMTMKLGIATALAHHPRLLILDEATSGLDPMVREEILDVFLDFVQDENHSVLLSSHIITDLEKIADYITFIHNGQVVFSKKKDELIYDYGIIRCGEAQFSAIDDSDILAFRNRDYQVDVLVRNRHVAAKKYRDYVIDNVSIEEVMLLLAKGARK